MPTGESGAVAPGAGAEGIAGARFLHQIFAQSVARDPDHPAIDVPPPLDAGPGEVARQVLSYAELDRFASQIAAALSKGIPSATDEVVAILLPRSAPALYAAQLAVHRAGSAFLCLDPRFPEEHLRAVLTDAGVRTVITDPAGRTRLRDAGCLPVRCITALWALKVEIDITIMTRDELGPHRSSPQPPATNAAPNDDGESADDLAYVIYTSGTTGAPKGVLLTHRGIINLVNSDHRVFGLGARDRVAQISSPAYDSSIEETWLAFAAGATLVPIDDETLRAGPDLVGWLAREGVSVLCPPPTLLRTLHCDDPHRQLPALRLVYVGGEPMPADLVDRWAPGRRLVNGYGPTECTVVVTRAELRPGRPVTIGRAIDGHQAFVLDAELEPSSEGEPGELCVAGPGLALGYLGRPKETAARFVDHPRWGRIYRTGDLVRRDERGELHFLGRIDDQVKLRGYRIELGAVEAQLAALPGVRAAGCRIQGEGARRLLAAHLVAEDPDDTPTLEELRHALQRQIPAHMVPGRWAWTSRLPTTTGGKLNRVALPEILGEASRVRPDAPASSKATSATAVDREDDQGSDPDLTALVARLANVAAVVLDLEQDPPPDADFFRDLGGDSLSVVALVSAWRKADDGPKAAEVIKDTRGPGAIAPAPALRAVGDRPAWLKARDVYEGITIARIAARILSAQERADDALVRETVRVPTLGGPQPSGERVPMAAADPRGDERADRVRPWLVTWAQAGWLVGAQVVGAALAAWLLLRAMPWFVELLGVTASLLLAPVLGYVVRLLWLPLAVGATVVLKRLLIGRYEPMRVPVWSGFYLRHWIVARTAATIPWRLIEGTVVVGVVLRALGARVGERVHFHRGVALAGGGWDLLEIGAGATLAQDAAVRTVELEAQSLIIGPVAIGEGALLDVRAGLSPHSAIGANATLSPLSWLPPGGRIEAGRHGHGVPALDVGPADAVSHRKSDPEADSQAARGLRMTERFEANRKSGAQSDARSGAQFGAQFGAQAGDHEGGQGSLPIMGRALSPAAHAGLMVALRGLRGLLAWLPGTAILAIVARWQSVSPASVEGWLGDPSIDPRWFLGLSALLIAALPLGLFAQLLAYRAAGSIRPGSYELWSLAGLRIWAKSGVVDAVGRWLSGSLYWPPWLRAAGMRLGPRCEISTIIDVLPETVRIGAESFFADGIYLCSPRVRAGTIDVSRSTLGAGTFLGNHAVISAGHDWPEGMFVGVATLPDPDRALPDGGWFGHPAMPLHRREVVEADRSLTHEPPPWRYVVRLGWETLRFALPLLPWWTALAWLWLLATLDGRIGAGWLFGLAAPLATFAAVALTVLATIALKWLLLGRVSPGQHAFWSGWCARWDFVYVAWQRWARGPLSVLEGTLLQNAVLRLFGMSIGRRVVLGSGFAQVVDPDMLRFEDDATVACDFQAHTFEDRILKIDRLRIGKGATVGPGTVVFYGADIGDGAVVAPHGVVMKRAVLEAGWRYEGQPVGPASGS